MVLSRGTLDDFRFYYRYRDSKGADTTHAHTGIEIHMCESGKGFFRSERTEVAMVPGLVTIIYSPRLHRVLAAPGYVYRRTVIHIPPALINKALTFLDLEKESFLPNYKKPIVQYVPETREYVDLTRICRQIQSKQQSRRGYISPDIGLYISELIYVLSQLANKPSLDLDQISPHDKMIVSRVNAIVEADPLYDHSVSDLAQRVGVSRGHLRRVFVETFNMPPRDYLLSRLMEAAKELLIAGTPIAAVASKCGFSNTSSFSRSFRSYVGTSPTEYIRSFRQG